MAVIGGPNPTGLFGIFDGHGGIEVAEFVSRHFEEALRSSPAYKSM
jgi:serine/threonine protein phosphatase PrpC